jgi:hypothetical protein
MAWGAVMDLSSLGSLGKVAGLAGIAIGMVVLLVRPIIDRASSLPAAQRAPMLRLVAVGAFGIAGLGIVAWLLSGSLGVKVIGGPCGVTSGGNASGNSVNCGTVPAGSAGKP